MEKKLGVLIDPQKCNGDGICVDVCPMNHLECKGDSSVPSEKETDSTCIHCGHCLAVCPSGAVTLDGIKADDCLPITKKASIKEAVQMLSGRRSIRMFKDRDIEREKIKRLLDIASSAPTAGNSQQVEWIAINSKKEVHQVAGMVIDSFRDMIKNNHPLAGRYPAARFVQAWENGMDMVLRDAPALVMAHVPADYSIGTVDCSIALTYLDVAAPSLDLGTCWAGIMMIALAHSRELAKKLDIPDAHECRGVMLLGYPQYRYSRIAPRNKAKILWV